MLYIYLIFISYSSTLRHKLGYKLDLVDKPMPLEQREPAFGTARLSVTWKICLPYLIPDKKLMTAQVAKSMPQRRGMIVSYIHIDC